MHIFKNGQCTRFAFIRILIILSNWHSPIGCLAKTGQVTIGNSHLWLRSQTHRSRSLKRRRKSLAWRARRAGRARGRVRCVRGTPAGTGSSTARPPGQLAPGRRRPRQPKHPKRSLGSCRWILLPTSILKNNGIIISLHKIMFLVSSTDSTLICTNYIWLNWCFQYFI